MVIVRPTFTVTASSAYSSGNGIGGKATISNALAVSNGTVCLDEILIVDRANQKPVGELFIFESNPVIATLTDKTAMVLSTDDIKIIARIVVASGDWTTTNSKGICNLRNLGALLKGADSSRDLYCAYVTTSTPTFAATSDFKVTLFFLQGSTKN